MAYPYFAHNKHGRATCKAFLEEVSKRFEHKKLKSEDPRLHSMTEKEKNAYIYEYNRRLHNRIIAEVEDELVNNQSNARLSTTLK